MANWVTIVCEYLSLLVPMYVSYVPNSSCLDVCVIHVLGIFFHHFQRGNIRACTVTFMSNVNVFYSNSK